MPRERTWLEMSKRERLEVLSDAVEPERRATVMERVEKHFRGGRAQLLQNPVYAANVVLREAWRDEHGNTDEWDRAAEALPGAEVPHAI